MFIKIENDNNYRCQEVGLPIPTLKIVAFSFWVCNTRMQWRHYNKIYFVCFVKSLLILKIYIVNELFKSSSKFKNKCCCLKKKLRKKKIEWSGDLKKCCIFFSDFRFSSTNVEATKRMCSQCLTVKGKAFAFFVMMMRQKQSRSTDDIDSLPQEF